MDELSIKIKICDRIYPMKTDHSEEGLIRKAAEIINERIDDYKKNFGTDDYQDLLSIACFNFLIELMKLKKETKNRSDNHSQLIRDLNSKIEKLLTEID